MGILLRWKIPTDSDVSYDKTYIYRSDSKNGTYEQIAVQNISDNTYFDKNGTTSHWYKIRFYDSANDIWSDYSDPIQGGSFSFYCTIEDVRTVSGLSESEISDSELYNIMQRIALPQINADLNIRVIREKIEYIDETRQNDIDSNNTTFYVKNWKEFYIGDLNNDGIVDENDVIVYQVDANGTETQLTVNTVYPNEGKFVLDSAPEGDKDLYVTYCYAPVSESDPHPLLRAAFATLVAAWAYTRLDAGKLKSYSIGKLRIAKQSDAFVTFYQKYKQLLNELKSKPIKKIEGQSVYELLTPVTKVRQI